MHTILGLDFHLLLYFENVIQKFVVFFCTWWPEEKERKHPESRSSISSQFLCLKQKRCESRGFHFLFRDFKGKDLHWQQCLNNTQIVLAELVYGRERPTVEGVNLVIVLFSTSKRKTETLGRTALIACLLEGGSFEGKA